jgi:hypothetical protein
MTTTSFTAEVIADSSGKFCGNGLRFATAEEAASYANNLMMRWTAVSETRVVPTQGPPTHRYIKGHGARKIQGENT